MKHFIKYTVLIGLTVFLGLQSRNQDLHLPVFIADHAGDTLWTLMVYWGFRLISPSKTPKFALIAALIFSFLIELSQLYQADWANAFRKNRFAALVFGSGFLWIDLVRYTIGGFLGFAIDRLFQKTKKVAQ